MIVRFYLDRELFLRFVRGEEDGGVFDAHVDLEARYKEFISECINK